MAADQRKLREGVGVEDLAIVGQTVLAATRHGLYRRDGEGSWRRLPEPPGRVTRLRVLGAIVFATAAEGVWRLEV